MKRNLKILGWFIIIFILGICFSTISNAAIEIKPGTEPHTSITVSTSYQYCYDMRSSTSTLGVNSLDPHLTLNADWGAVAYLGASTYGNVRSVKGTEVTIEENTYYSTTNNITGVMDFGADTKSLMRAVQTASLFEGADKSTDRTNLENNINTRYVEKISDVSSVQSTLGLAIKETKSWYNSSASEVSVSWPVVTRNSVFGVYSGLPSFTWGTYGTGCSNGSTTYRPVIWN